MLFDHRTRDRGDLLRTLVVAAELGHQHVGIQAQIFAIQADEPPGVDVPTQNLKIVFFDGRQIGLPHPGFGSHVSKRSVLSTSLASKFLSDTRHVARKGSRRFGHEGLIGIVVPMTDRGGSSGPLHDIRVLEIQGIGPGPFAAMVLADLGADVIRVDRTTPGGLQLGGAESDGHDVLARSRRSVALNLKDPAGVALLLQLTQTVDVLIEGFRPGVAERLGIGPTECHDVNPRLVYGRMTGWGQDGPWAGMAGHDLDYIALAGALLPMGQPDQPPPVPLNLIGDFGGGGMLLVIGVLAALQERQRSGNGQVVDAAMVDGSALLMAMFHGMSSLGLWQDSSRRDNLLDGGAPFYSTYACADGGYVAVGALEPAFYLALLDGLDLTATDWPQHDKARWPQLRATLASRFASADRTHWEQVFDGTDACVAPILSMREAPAHPHLQARKTFVDVDGVTHPAPAPRFSATPSRPPKAPRQPGQDTTSILDELGIGASAIAELDAKGVIMTGADRAS